MASVLRTAGLANLNFTGFIISGLCKATRELGGTAVTQVARISGRELRRDRTPKPAPYDWRHKSLPVWTIYTDPMMERFDENTKIVVVEGMPGVGKDKFARKLAEELEMKYTPAPNFDDLWVNAYGFDSRSLNEELPPDARAYDLATFLRDPKDVNVAAMQIAMLSMRCNQYVDALAHLLSSGEGIVLQRAPWTDSVFMRAMAKCGYVSALALDYHRCAAKGTLLELLKPHLIVYLDAPIPVIKENIQRRNIPYEVNSKALTEEYLNELQVLYKEYLREMSNDAHLLIYDWRTEGDVGVVVEDIERLDFDIGDTDNPGRNTITKFHDWKFDQDTDIYQRRWDYCMDKQGLLSTLHVPRFDVPELLRSPEDESVRAKLFDEVESEKYASGYNPACGDNILFKSKYFYEDWLPRSKVGKQQR